MGEVRKFGVAGVLRASRRAGAILIMRKGSEAPHLLIAPPTLRHPAERRSRVSKDAPRTLRIRLSQPAFQER